MGDYKRLFNIGNTDAELALKNEKLVIHFGLSRNYFCSVERLIDALNGKPYDDFEIHNKGGAVTITRRSDVLIISKEDMEKIRHEYAALAHKATEYPSTPETTEATGG